MRTIELDVTHIQTVRALHIYLAYRLELPAYYGQNLDALYDVLTGDARGLHIVLRGVQAAQGELAAYAPRLLRVLRDAAQENTALQVSVLS